MQMRPALGEGTRASLCQWIRIVFGGNGFGRGRRDTAVVVGVVASPPLPQALKKIRLAPARKPSATRRSRTTISLVTRTAGVYNRAAHTRAWAAVVVLSSLT
jgi:hypothetical protein